MLSFLFSRVMGICETRHKDLFDTVPRVKKIAKGRKVSNKITLDAFKDVPHTEIQALRDSFASTFADICEGMEFEETVKPLQDQSIAQFI